MLNKTSNNLFYIDFVWSKSITMKLAVNKPNMLKINDYVSRSTYDHNLSWCRE